MMKIKNFVFNPFQVNTYIIYSGDEGFIIDAACSDEREFEELIQFTEKENINIKALINTHCHVDHLLGVERLRNYFNAEFLCPENEKSILKSAGAQGQFFGFDLQEPSQPDRFLSEGDKLDFGDIELDIYEIPGHSPGSLVYHSGKEDKLFSGDVLFSGSIGRTDLPGGDYKKLVEGIRYKLLNLSDEVEVFPGHGPSTTIGKEKLLNPFLQESS
jgi:glyoxylase-like metal-dependent hydrolase (beta-lactamase superfamily II)